MKVSDLDFNYPQNLVATVPQWPPRVMLCKLHQGAVEELQLDGPFELNWNHFLDEFQKGDLLIINETKVLRRRVFAENQIEIVFLKELNLYEWEVLFPSKNFQIGQQINLPHGIKAELLQKGRPQILRLDEPITESYFEEHGEMPLPPYIQKARQQRHQIDGDENWYQTNWAKNPGSLAAPTASLHFRQQDLALLEERGVRVAKLTLHVGLGTFLPVVVEDLNDHSMHSEFVSIPQTTMSLIEEAKSKDQKIWGLGTTVVRALESIPLHFFKLESSGDWIGETNLLIQPGFQWTVVDRMITNFHQPKSTLLALVSSFAGIKNTQRCYEWAIDNQFRLFSYGDLSVWKRE